MNDNELDPDILLEYLENEFLGFDFLDHVVLEDHPPLSNVDGLLGSNNQETRRHPHPPLPLFRAIHSRNVQPEGPNRRRTDNLTPVPPQRSFESFRDSNTALLASSTPSVHDVRFYLDAMTVQGLPKSIVNAEGSSDWLGCLGSALTLSIKIRDDLRVFRLIRSSSRGSSEVSYALRPVTSKRQNSNPLYPQWWEFADYFGSTEIEFIFEKTSRFSYQTTVIARKKMTLARFYENQKMAERNQQYFCQESHYNWLLPLELELDLIPTTTGLLRRFSGSVTPTPSHPAPDTSSDWWTTLTQSKSSTTSSRSKPRFSQPKYHSTPQTVPVRATTTTTTTSRAVPTAPPPPITKRREVIKVSLNYRILFLDHCYKPLITTSFLTNDISNSNPNSNTNSNSTSNIHGLTDFHVLVAKAPAAVVVEVMKVLAWRGILPRVLATPSSLGYWPLEIALRVGNASVVLELLQRTGYLCLPPLLPQQSSPLHHCIVGNSLPCFEYLQKFLSKYGGGGGGSRSQRLSRPGQPSQPSQSESLTWETCLEWRDSSDHTPFTFACSLPHRTALIKELLLAGVEVGQMNRQSQKTGLMYASESGDVAIVETLLSIQDIPRGEQELAETVRGMQSQQRGTTRRLLTSSSHLSIPAHYHPITPTSEDLMTSASLSPSHSRYPSPLSLANYPCLPNYREPLTGKQAIHFAAESGQAEIVLLLLKVGVSCGEVDYEGRTVYHIAVERGLESLVSQLIAVEREKWRQYLQTSHSKKGYETMMSPLRPLLIRNSRGKLPVDLAMDQRKGQMARLLIEGMLEIYQWKPETSPVKGKQVSNKGGGAGSFVSLNLSAIRRPIEETPHNAALYLSKEMTDWLLQLKQQLDGEPTSRGREEERESHLTVISRSVSPVTMMMAVSVSRSSSITGDGRDLGEDSKKEETTTPTTNNNSNTTASHNNNKSSQLLRSYFSPFSSHWIGSLRGGQSSNSKGGESKDESVVLEEKEDEGEASQRWQAIEEEEWNDSMEYLLALTPLALRTIKPDIEL